MITSQSPSSSSSSSLLPATPLPTTTNSLTWGIDHTIIRLVLPLLSSVALDPLMYTVDTYLVGKYFGRRALTAFGIMERVFHTGYYLLGYFLTVPTSPIGEEEEEKEEREGMGRAHHHLTAD